MEVSSPVVERKKAIIIPPIRIVLRRSTALVENHTKKARAKQKSKEPVPLEMFIHPKLLIAFSVILPPEVI
jgi:hypothetical protein